MKRLHLFSNLRRARVASGFTLVELLTVLSIIAIIATFSISAFIGVNASLNLSSAAQMVSSEITTARQTALTYSETVEVRFYLYNDPVTGVPQYQSLQSFSSTDGINFTQLDRPNYLPANIMINQASGTPATALSYPLGESSTTVNPAYTPNAANGAITLAIAGLNYTYKSLRFKVDGSVDYIIPSSAAPTGWPPSCWFVTLHEKKFVNTAPALIKNYITVSVDSTDGRVRTYQP